MVGTSVGSRKTLPSTGEAENIGERILLAPQPEGFHFSAGTITTLIDFEDFGAIGETQLPNGYHGMTWQNFYAFTPTLSFDRSGYENGTVSGQNVGFNGGASDCAVSDDTNFDFASAWITGAWNNGLHVTVQGYDDGVLKYAVNLIVDTTGPTLFEFDFLNVDRVTFHSEGGTNAGLSGGGEHFAIDDLTFGVSPGAITGMVWNDLDGDGLHEAGEPGLRNRTVILDDNGNGLVDAGEVTAITNRDGTYSFAAVAPGTHSLTQVLPPHWAQTGVVGTTIVTVGSGATVDGPDFLAADVRATTGDLSGTIFDDRNRDHLQGGSEPGLAGWTVFLDGNGNGVRDAGEAMATTDDHGRYLFTTLAPGEVTVAVELPAPGWEAWQAAPLTATIAAGGTTADQDIAVTGSASLFDDMIRSPGISDDRIDALDGNDVVKARGGADQLYGGLATTSCAAGSATTCSSAGAARIIWVAGTAPTCSSSRASLATIAFAISSRRTAT